MFIVQSHSHILKCDLSIQTLFWACIGKTIVAEVFRISYFIGRTNRLSSLVERMSEFHISESIYLRCDDVQTSENTNIKASAPIRQSVSGKWRIFCRTAKLDD